MNLKKMRLTGPLMGPRQGTHIREDPPGQRKIRSQFELEDLVRSLTDEAREKLEALLQRGYGWKDIGPFLEVSLVGGSGPRHAQLNHGNVKEVILRTIASLKTLKPKAGSVSTCVTLTGSADSQETTNMATTNPGTKPVPNGNAPVPVQQPGESYEAYLARLAMTNGTNPLDLLKMKFEHQAATAPSSGSNFNLKAASAKVLTATAHAGGRVVTATTIALLAFFVWALAKNGWDLKSNVLTDANALWRENPWTATLLALLWVTVGTVLYRPTVTYGGGLLFLVLWPLSVVVTVGKKYILPGVKFAGLYTLDRIDALFNGYLAMQRNLVPKLGVPKLGRFADIADTDPMAQVTAATWAPRSTVGRPNNS